MSLQKKITRTKPKCNWQLIADKLKQLPEGYRLVLNLHLIEGLKYEEIAQMMQLTPSTRPFSVCTGQK